MSEDTHKKMTPGGRGGRGNANQRTHRSGKQHRQVQERFWTMQNVGGSSCLRRTSSKIKRLCRDFQDYNDMPTALDKGNLNTWSFRT